MGQEQIEVTQIFYDNRFAITIAKNSTLHGRTKHMDKRFHFIRDLVADDLIILQYCSTGE